MLRCTVTAVHLCLGTARCEGKAQQPGVSRTGVQRATSVGGKALVRKRAAEHPRSQGQVCLSRVLFPTARSRERRRACSGKLQRSRATDQTAASVETPPKRSQVRAALDGQGPLNHAQRQRPRSHAAQRGPNSRALYHCCCLLLLATPRSAWCAGPPTRLIW